MVFDGCDEGAYRPRHAGGVAMGEHRLVADELHEPRSVRHCGCRCQSVEVSHCVNDLLWPESFDHARRIDKVDEPNRELGELLGSFGVAENPVPCERNMQPEQQIQGARDLFDKSGAEERPLGVSGLRLPRQGISVARQRQRGFRRRARGGAQRPQKPRQ